MNRRELEKEAMSDKTFHQDVVRLAHDHPELREDLVPVLREAAKKPKKIQWYNYGSYANHRKYLKKVLEVIEARNAPSIKYMKPGTPGYDWVKAKWGGKGAAVNFPRMKGRVAMNRGRHLFVGTVAGEEIILAHIDFVV